MESLIPAVGRTFQAYSSGEAAAPERTVLPLPLGATLTMPAYLPHEGFTTVKVASVYPENPARGLATIHGVVALLDAKTGVPLVLMDAAYLTGARTGAASGAATDALASPTARSLAVFGTGFQARFQVEAVACVRPLERVQVYSPDQERCERFVAQLRERFRSAGREVEVAAATSARQAASGAEVVCVATSSSEPVFEARDLAQGAHVNGVGSYRLDMRETPADFVRAARVVVDSREAARAEAGDLLPGVEAGDLAWEDLPELGEVLAGVAPGRRSSGDWTFFKSVGLPVQDCAAAALVYRRALDLDLGVRLSL